MKLFNQLWDFFTAVKLAIFTLSALAVTSIIGTIIPQGESHAFYVKNFGARTAEFFQILDVDAMYYSWWFLGLLGLLATNLIVCSIERFPRVWKIICADNLRVSPERIGKMANFSEWQVSANPGIEINPERVLETNGWRTAKQSGEKGELFFSQKGRWSRTGVYIVHLSILVIFVGAIIGHFLGFKGSVMVPEMGSTQKAFSYKNSDPIDFGFEVRCNSFGIEFYDNGMPKEYRSSLTVLEGGEEKLTREIEVNDPLTYKGITFYQSSYQGYQDFIFTITNKASGESKLFSVPFQQQIGWDEQQVRFGVVNAEAAGQRVVRSKIWFKTADQPPLIEWLDDNTEMAVGGDSGGYLVSVKQMYATGLQVAKDPGVWVVYIGCGLMLIGLYMAFFMSHRRIWLYRENTKGTVRLSLGGSANKNKLAFARDFNAVVKTVDTTLQG